MQHFGYLNKVAATVCAEQDSVKAHLDRRMEAVSQQNEMLPDKFDNADHTEILFSQAGTDALKQPGMLKFTYQEIKRITLAHSKLRPGQRRSGAMAAQSETLSIWWNLFIFFAMLGLFVVLLWWAIEKKQSGCLASAIAVVAIIVLFFLALGIN
ncbi:MAG: hypothetical protein AB7V36_11465 [Bacteroidales bacterium]